MRGRKRKLRRRKEAASVRASISFPADVYKSLEDIANQKKVSLGWVVREAAENYLAEKWPLFRTPRQGSTDREK
jgi:metal-responsive CopG/Arc/MetJ family transcriptional regulator